MSPRDEGGLGILFVCTGNICRSPFAELRTAAALSGTPHRLASAGVRAVTGAPMDALMAAQLTARRIDPSRHRGRQLVERLIDDADLVLTFEFRQRLHVLDAWPQAIDKTYSLRHFAVLAAALPPSTPASRLVEEVDRLAVPDSMTNDIADPYRRGRRAAAACAAEIDAALGTIVPVLRRVASI